MVLDKRQSQYPWLRLSPNRFANLDVGIHVLAVDINSHEREFVCLVELGDDDRLVVVRLAWITYSALFPSPRRSFVPFLDFPVITSSTEAQGS